MLDGGTEVATQDGGLHRIVRGLLVCDTAVTAGANVVVPLRIAVTHLDHMCEKQRTVQVNHLRAGQVVWRGVRWNCVAWRGVEWRGVGEVEGIEMRWW